MKLLVLTIFMLLYFCSLVLQHMVPSFYQSCADMLSKWDKLVPGEGSCELDVWPHLQAMTSDVISRTAFGSSYEEGRKVFELLKDQQKLLMKVRHSVYIPGWRLVDHSTLVAPLLMFACLP